MLRKHKHGAGLASAGGLALVSVLFVLAGCQPGDVQMVVVTEVLEGEVVERVITAPPAAAAAAEDIEPYTEGEEPAATEEAESRAPGNASPLVAALPQDRLIIKNGEISLLVENADIAIDRVTQIAVDNGGYVLTGETWFTDEYKSATMTIAVDSRRFEVAMRRLRDVAIRVLAESSSGEDVTSEYVDLDSRLRNLEATRDRIQTFLEQADNVSEALDINEQLAEIEAEIEQVKGRMTYLSGRAAFSTITVNLEVPRPTPTPTLTPTATPTSTPTATPTQWSPGATFNSAARTQSGLARGLADALIWMAVVIGPYLLVVVVFGFGLRAAFWRGRKNSKP